METETGGGGDVRFSPTAWTLVRRAQAGSREAWDGLIAAYWKPAYFFVRRRGHDVESAKDLVQGFFAVALEKDFLDGVSADKGRFRNYLLAALSHYLSNQADRANARKRGGGIDFLRAEADLASAEPGPEAAFMAAWAREVLARAPGIRRERPPAWPGLVHARRLPDVRTLTGPTPGSVRAS